MASASPVHKFACTFTKTDQHKHDNKVLAQAIFFPLAADHSLLTSCVTRETRNIIGICFRLLIPQILSYMANIFMVFHPGITISLTILACDIDFAANADFFVLNEVSFVSIDGDDVFHQLVT